MIHEMFIHVPPLVTGFPSGPFLNTVSLPAIHGNRRLLPLLLQCQSLSSLFTPSIAHSLTQMWLSE